MPIELKIVGNAGLIFKGTVDFCEIPAESGIEGIMPGHVNFISNINEGAVKYKIGESVKEIKIGGGFVELSGDSLNILMLN